MVLYNNTMVRRYRGTEVKNFLAYNHRAKSHTPPYQNQLTATVACGHRPNASRNFMGSSNVSNLEGTARGYALSQVRGIALQLYNTLPETSHRRMNHIHAPPGNRTNALRALTILSNYTGTISSHTTTQLQAGTYVGCILLARFTNAYHHHQPPLHHHYYHYHCHRRRTTKRPRSACNLLGCGATG